MFAATTQLQPNSNATPTYFQLNSNLINSNLTPTQLQRMHTTSQQGNSEWVTRVPNCVCTLYSSTPSMRVCVFV